LSYLYPPYSIQPLIDELTQWESQINAANHSDDEEEEDQEEDGFIPPEGMYDVSERMVKQCIQTSVFYLSILTLL